VAVSPQIRTNHGVSGITEERRHAVPGGVRAWMAVQEHYRGAVATRAAVDDDTCGQTEVPEIESVEH